MQCGHSGMTRGRKYGTSGLPTIEELIRTEVLVRMSEKPTFRPFAKDTDPSEGLNERMASWQQLMGLFRRFLQAVPIEYSAARASIFPDKFLI